MAQRHPELCYAFVGTGQMVSQRETDRILYRQMLADAQRTGDRALERKLRVWGQPPYNDITGYATQMDYYDRLEPYSKVPASEAASGIGAFFPAEYGLIDSWNALRGFGAMFSVLYPQLQGIDFRQTATRLIWFDRSGHNADAEEPGRFKALMIDTVLTETYSAAGTTRWPDGSVGARQPVHRPVHCSNTSARCAAC